MQLNQRRVPGKALDHVVEVAPHVGLDFGQQEHRHGLPLLPDEMTDIVDAVEVIRVVVGEDDRVYAFRRAVGEELLPHIRARIDQQGFARDFDQDRWPAAAVARMTWIALSPVSGHQWHAARGSTAQDRDLNL